MGAYRGRFLPPVLPGKCERSVHGGGARRAPAAVDPVALPGDQELLEVEDRRRRRLLAEQAEPFRNKTIEIHESNLRRIAAGYYDAWIEKSLRRLAELWPARYAKEERSESFVQSLR